MKDDSELKAILPEHNLDTDIKEHVRSRQGKSRTKVRFITVDSEQRLCNEDAVFIFVEDLLSDKLQSTLLPIFQIQEQHLLMIYLFI